MRKLSRDLQNEVTNVMNVKPRSDQRLSRLVPTDACQGMTKMVAEGASTSGGLKTRV